MSVQPISAEFIEEELLHPESLSDENWFEVVDMLLEHRANIITALGGRPPTPPPPTTNPTDAPTKKPTKVKPTKVPTKVPTVTPTTLPTTVPTVTTYTIRSSGQNGGIAIPTGTWELEECETIILSFESEPGYELDYITDLVTGEKWSPAPSFISLYVDRNYDIAAVGKPRNQVRVDFTATPLTGMVVLEVTFTPVSIGSIEPDTWVWNFGNGEIKEMKSDTPVSTIYTMPGLYTVSLEGIRGALSGTETKTHYILVEPKIGGEECDAPPEECEVPPPVEECEIPVEECEA
ncbi:MAG: PKD domain-containing protein [Methanomicrobiales archaeon]|nr:PKD domain-containing protein [Methanomicrobiales archaeon]